MYREAIRERFSVVSVSGDEFCCRCPWHDDTEGKLYVNSRTGLYYCFSGSCGKKGKLDSKALDSKTRCMVLKDKVKAVRAQDNGVEFRRYPEAWLNQFVPHPYWHDVRGFSQQTIELFNLGYDPMVGRLTIPLRSMSGDVLGVIHRRLDDVKPKYLHPAGFHTGRHLFGAHLVGKHRKVGIVEGPLDAIACWDAGIPAVATFGSRLTEGQAEMVRKLGIQTLVVMTDNDLPGRQAVRSIKAGVSGVGVLVGEYEPHWSAKDPGELSKVKRKQLYHTAVPFHVWKKRHP